MTRATRSPSANGQSLLSHPQSVAHLATLSMCQFAIAKGCLYDLDQTPQPSTPLGLHRRRRPHGRTRVGRYTTPQFVLICRRLGEWSKIVPHSGVAGTESKAERNRNSVVPDPVVSGNPIALFCPTFGDGSAKFAKALLADDRRSARVTLGDRRYDALGAVAGSRCSDELHSTRPTG